MVVLGNKRLSKYQQKKRQKCVLRTLDNLPMNYSFHDSTRLAHSCRTVRNIHMAEEKLAKRISENQTSHSRRLFENVLNTKSYTCEISGKEQTPRSIRSCPPIMTQADLIGYTVSMPITPGHSGPTRYGSPLYAHHSNGEYVHTQQTTVSIQTPPKYFRATPVIEKTLQRSMSAYKVVRDKKKKSDADVQSRPVSSFPGFMLVPKPCEETNYVMLSMDSENEGDKTRNYSFLSWKKNQARHKLSSMFPEPDNLNGCENDEDDVIKDVAKKLEKVKNDGLRKGSSNDSTRSHVGRADAQTKKEKAQDMLNKEEKEVTGSKESKERFTNDPTQTSDSKLSLQRKPSQSKLTKGKRGKKDRKLKDNDISTSSISEEKHTGPSLPTYICPSSEEKSKESRIRHWLCESTFSKASKNVPLV